MTIPAKPLALPGSTIDANAGAGLTVGGATSADGAATSDARIQAGGAISLATVTAGEDVVLGTTSAANAPASTLTSGALVGGRDIAVNVDTPGRRSHPRRPAA